MLRRAAASVSLAFMASLLGTTVFALLSAPREYEGWITQDWAQGGQDEHRRGLYEPVFEIGNYEDPKAVPEITQAPSWASDPLSFFDSIPGQAALQYYPSATDLGFGWQVNFRNSYVNGVETAFLDVRQMPTGRLTGSFPVWLRDQEPLSFPCRAIGTPMLLKPIISVAEGTFSMDIAFVFGSLDCNAGYQSTPLFVNVLGFCKETVRGGSFSQCLEAPAPGNQTTQVYNSLWLGGGRNAIFDSNRAYPSSPVYGDAAFYFGDVQANYSSWTNECGEVIDCNSGNTRSPAECSPGRIWALKESIGVIDWEPAWPQLFSELKTGEPSCRPPPLGQPPPEPMRYYRTITSPALYKTDLLVIGAALNYPGKKWEYEDNSTLLALDPRSGAFLWAFEVPGELIMPEPIILDSLIIFGTNQGRAFALAHDGTLRWATPAGNRLTFQPTPYSSAALQEVVSLYGPAVQLSQAYVYFGGSDGRIHRFDAQNGDRMSSKTLAYYRSAQIDSNGLYVIKPCPIRAAPAAGRDGFLIAKSSTENINSLQNGSYLMAVKIPDLSFNPRIASDNAGYCLDPDKAMFTKGTLEYGGLPLAPTVTMLDDTIWSAYYVNSPGNNFILGENEHDSGGVSLAEAYAFATNAGAQVLAVPSCKVRPKFPDTGEEQLPPVPPTLNLPPPLGPIRVYPNPFNPAKAVKGTLKFRNLPAGSRIEISTLAHERVAVLLEGNNRAEWNGRNEVGQEVASGVYIYRIIQPDGAPPVTGQIALIRR